MRRHSPLPVRQVIRTERPGGSAFVRLFPPPVAAYLQRQLRLASWRLRADHSHNGDMRAIIAALAALGGGVILAAFVVSVARGDGSEAQWLLLGPMPFWLIGLIAYLRQPGRPVVWWLVGVGVAFGCNVALGTCSCRWRRSTGGSPPRSPPRSRCWHLWFGVGRSGRRGRPGRTVPVGRPERAYERVVIWTVALAGFLLPLLQAASLADISSYGGPAGSVAPIVFRALYVPALAPAGRSRGGRDPHQSGLDARWRGHACAALPAYRRGPATADPLAAVRHRGVCSACGSRRARSGSWPTRTARRPAWQARCCPAWREVTTLGSVLGALFYTGVFGIDEPARRAFVHRVLRVSIGVVLALLAVLAGVLTSLAAPPPPRWRSPWPPGRRARPFGAGWRTPSTAGCSARGWPATPASVASARA